MRRRRLSETGSPKNCPQKVMTAASVVMNAVSRGFCCHRPFIHFHREILVKFYLEIFLADCIQNSFRGTSAMIRVTEILFRQRERERESALFINGPRQRNHDFDRQPRRDVASAERKPLRSSLKNLALGDLHKGRKVCGGAASSPPE